MFKKCLATLLVVLVLSLSSFAMVSAQDELPIAEEDFAIAETLVFYCFGGVDNYYAFLFAETEEDSSFILTEYVGFDEEGAATFLFDLATLSEELGEDVDEVTAQSYFYAYVLTSCFGEEIVPAVTEAQQDIEYFVIYFELDEEATAYFYYIYEYAYYYESVETYLIESGVDPSEVDYILYELADEEAVDEPSDEETLSTYFEENEIAIDYEEFATDVDELEAAAEETYTEDEAYIEEEVTDEGGE
jgi:hypothetical protein